MHWELLPLALGSGFAFGCGNALAKWIIWRNCHRIQSMTWRRLGSVGSVQAIIPLRRAKDGSLGGGRHEV